MILLCVLERSHFTLTVPLPRDFNWYGLGGGGGGPCNGLRSSTGRSRNTPSCVLLMKPEICTGLISHWVILPTPPPPPPHTQSPLSFPTYAGIRSSFTLTIYSNNRMGAFLPNHTDGSDRDNMCSGCCESMGRFMIPRQQRLLVLDLFKKPHEVHKAISWGVLLWVNKVVGMNRHIEPGFFTNDHCMWWVNIDFCNGIWREKNGVTYTQ